MDAAIETSGHDGSRCFMVISPFLGPSAKERLADAGISYADATGNMRFVTSRPASSLKRRGGPQLLAEERSVAIATGTAQRQSGPGVPGLPTPYGTRELATLSDNAPASISRVAELLERDAIIERAGPQGAIVSVD